MSADDRKDLPPVSSPNFLEKVREALGVYLGNRGDKLDRGVTLRDLADSGIVALRPGFLTGGGRIPPIGGIGTAISGAYEPDLTPPPTPSGFAATTSKTSIQVVTDPQTYTQGHGHAKTQVLGAKYLTGDPLPVFADAVVLDEFSGDVHAFPVDPAALYRLWVKWVTVDGRVSPPAGGTNGVLAEAGLLDSEHIAFLTASKIRAGSISVGEHIQSAGYVAGSAGWRINGDGTAELSGVVVRGTVYATTGEFSGDISAATGNFRGYITGGSYSGYGWPAGTGTGFYLGAYGLLLGNPSTGRYFQVEESGNVYAPGFSIVNGAASFSGALSAATGYFAGSLTAATGSFAGSLSAATGTFSGSLTASAISAVNTINIAGSAISESWSVAGSGSSVIGTTTPCTLSLTVPAGQTWQILAIAVCDASCTAGLASFETVALTLQYNSVTKDTTSLTANGPTSGGSSVTEKGGLITTHTEVFTAGSVVVNLICALTHTTTAEGSPIMTRPRLIVLVTKK